MRLNRQLQNAAICKEALFSLVWDTKMSSVLGMGRVHEFYGLKASQMSKVRASSHESS